MNYEDSSNIRLLDMSIVQLMIDAFLWRVNWELKLQPAFDVKLPKAFNQRYYHSFYIDKLAIHATLTTQHFQLN